MCTTSEFELFIVIDLVDDVLRGLTELPRGQSISKLLLLPLWNFVFSPFVLTCDFFRVDGFLEGGGFAFPLQQFDERLKNNL